ncbi:hypothetical protein GCM10023196_036800 [Actinoallomurus vinaceus]|uniref:Peptidase C51 domain-containing protein n=1 Tax=Actinoallomurus vinaceus TaxID=1080074 RepID=A0ABP8UBX4_9ACTN
MDGRDAFLAKALSQRGMCRKANGTTTYGTWFAELVHDAAFKAGDFCAMGLLWCADQTGQLDVLGGGNRAWAWVPSWWDHFHAQGRTTDKPGRGRIVFFNFGSGGPAHVGAVLQDNHDGTIETIEFNTLNGQCAPRTRSLSLVYGFADPAWPADPAQDEDLAIVVSLGA